MTEFESVLSALEKQRDALSVTIATLSAFAPKREPVVRKVQQARPPHKRRVRRTLTDDQKREIIALLGEHTKHRVIARRFHVPMHTIASWKTWTLPVVDNGGMDTSTSAETPVSG